MQKTYRELVSMIKDVEHIDSTEKALEVGIELVRQSTVNQNRLSSK
ncbi:hypothetical protein OAI40_00780 [Candidatus Pseudothioglobus singularis]|nr:hypothetical protein [Candidatus Pseudothioglobus singularis]MDB4597732.1 hypothetical protein [Candidatus Pseudothioglobus singularis]